MYKTVFKPFLDFLISLIILLAISPLFLMITIVLMLYYKGNPFFTQERPGKNEKIFKIIKYKTMNDNKDSNGNLLTDLERLNSIGYYLRKYSLDELPQLINVLKRDMSLIGPRPLLVEYLPFYDEIQKCRHNVRPGITGWAQVNGRNAISWENKFEYDIFYVNNLSFLLDIKIIKLTILKVIKKEGINQNGKVNDVPFRGKIVRRA
jgi:undecaprenyl phosphate N,N'-diacetylbacillosamine 1-phosphate transferase